MNDYIQREYRHALENARVVHALHSLRLLMRPLRARRCCNFPRADQCGVDPAELLPYSSLDQLEAQRLAGRLPDLIVLIVPRQSLQ